MQNQSKVDTVLNNQVPELKDYNLYLTDPALNQLIKKVASALHNELSIKGALLGAESTLRIAEDANQYPPELHTHSRTGERIDFVKFHPAWHQMMALARHNGIANRCFDHPHPIEQSPVYTATASHGAAERTIKAQDKDASPERHNPDQSRQSWLAYAALEYMHAQIEAGTMCPNNMTQASIPVLKKEDKLFAQLASKLLSKEHDARDIPWQQKKSVSIGMGMTEKQGGSDLRTNTSTATALLETGRGEEYHINGHKWFFSAPMSDAHLVLAKSEGGHSCFFVPRWRQDGTKNPIEIQRLKDKVGNRSNASSEVVFKNAWGIMVGEEGRGIPVILEMATYSRVNCILASAGFLRQAFNQSLHYAKYRMAFAKHLSEQPVMARLLADMALEAQAAMTTGLILASRFDQSTDELGMAWRRLMTPAAKFWICKRAVEVCGEAMEVFGGNGYIEEAPMGRLFRETPVNSIWEGSGNVMCLDVLRAIARNPDNAELMLNSMKIIAAQEARLTPLVTWLVSAVKKIAQHGTDDIEIDARLLTQKLVILAQACLLIEHAIPQIAEAFVATRTDPDWGPVLGVSSSISGVDSKKILALSWGV